MARSSPLAFLLLLGAYLGGFVGAPWFHDGEVVPAVHAEQRPHEPGLVPPDGKGPSGLHDARGCPACAWDILSRGVLLSARPSLPPAPVALRRAPSSQSWLAAASPRLPSARSPPRS